MLTRYLLLSLVVLSLSNLTIASSSQAGRGATRGSASSQREMLRPSSPDNWLGGTGNWSNGSDWSSGLPGSGSDVTINTSSDYVTLDTSSSINSLTLGGASGNQGDSTLIGDGNAHTLNIAGSLTIGHSGYFQLLNDTVTAGSVSTSGLLLLDGGSSLTVSGDVTINNAGGLLLSGNSGGGPDTLNVTGTVTNGPGGAFYVLGPGDVANVGQIVNHNYVQIGTGATLNLTNQSGLTDIASDADYIVQGTFTAQGNSALANLTTLEGALVLINGQNTTINPVGGTLTLNGSSGGFGGVLEVFEGTTVHVNGNVNVAVPGGILIGVPQGSNDSLYISGRLTLGQGSALLIDGHNDLVSVGSLNVMSGGILGPADAGILRVSGDVINNGCIGLCLVPASSGNTYDIGGTLNNGPSGNFNLQAGDQMNAAAVVSSGGMEFAAGARLSVGSLTFIRGAILDIGISGPETFGMILATGSVALNGELFVNVAGYNPPVGQEFKFLTFIPGALSGTFSSVVSNGENFAVDYDNSGGYVALVAEGNSTTPEPGSFLLLGSGVLSLAAMARRKIKA